ncbi:MAG: Trk system potassium transporter TrkA [Bacteroidales bacterium]|jgi:trk system potassium uptake protein TrkA
MKIVIAGVGDVGKYLAKMLNKEDHDLIVIDKNLKALSEIYQLNDLLTIQGDCTSFNVLKDASIEQCDLFISLTNNQDTNILSCIYAYKMGAGKTIARVDSMEYLHPIHKVSLIKFGIDKIIYPEYIAAREVVGVIKQTGTTEVSEFSGGKLALYVLRLDQNSPILNRKLKDIKEFSTGENFRIVAITREDKTIIPRGEDILKENDLVYIITNQKGIKELINISGKTKLDNNNIIFLGASRIGVKAAKMIEGQLKVTMIEKNEEKIENIVNELSKTTIINGDGKDVNILLEAGIEKADVFVAVTGDSETNILTCILAKKFGVPRTIAEVENMDYIEIANKMGIDSIVNKKLSAASTIYTMTMGAEISSIKCLTGTDAEVLEFVVSDNALVTKARIKELNLPEGVIIGGIVRGNKTIIAVGDTQIKPKDKVVLFALPSAIFKIAYYF